MWENRTLKKDAKFHLRGSFTMGLVLLLILTVITYLVNNLIEIFMSYNVLDELVFLLRSIPRNPESLSEEQSAVLGLVFASRFFKYAIVLSISTAILGIFLLQPLGISVKSWFVRNREIYDAPSLNMPFRHFGENYKNLFLGNLWKQLWMFIWSLPGLVAGLASMLVIIDFGTQAIQNNGVIEITTFHLNVLLISAVVSVINVPIIINRSIAYSMQSYILADNPNFGAKKSLILSKKMMKGNKWHTIVLALSFIGWALLATLFLPLTIGFSALLLNVYTSQTFAELYGALRNVAVSRGDVTPEQLGYIKQDSFDYSDSNFDASQRDNLPYSNDKNQSDNLNPYDPSWKNPYSSNRNEDKRSNSSDQSGSKRNGDF